MLDALMYCFTPTDNSYRVNIAHKVFFSEKDGNAGIFLSKHYKS